jgi:hypothetical protein
MTLNLRIQTMLHTAYARVNKEGLTRFGGHYEFKSQIWKIQQYQDPLKHTSPPEYGRGFLFIDWIREFMGMIYILAVRM